MLFTLLELKKDDPSHICTQNRGICATFASSLNTHSSDLDKWTVCASCWGNLSTKWKMKLFYICERSLMGHGADMKAALIIMNFQTTLNWTTWRQVSRTHAGCWCERGKVGRSLWRDIDGYRRWLLLENTRQEDEWAAWMVMTNNTIHSCWKHKADIPCCRSRLDIKNSSKSSNVDKTLTDWWCDALCSGISTLMGYNGQAEFRWLMLVHANGGWEGCSNKVQ